MIDLSPRPDAQGQSAPTMQLADAQDIIKQAVGFKTGRDEIKVTDVKLTSPAPMKDLEADWAQSQRWQNYMSLARQASLGVGALVALVLGGLFLRRLRPLAGPAAEKAEQPPSVQQFVLMAQRDPQAVARVLEAWLDEPEQTQRVAA